MIALLGVEGRGERGWEQGRWSMSTDHLRIMYVVAVATVEYTVWGCVVLKI